MYKEILTHNDVYNSLLEIFYGYEEYVFYGKKESKFNENQKTNGGWYVLRPRLRLYVGDQDSRSVLNAGRKGFLDRALLADLWSAFGSGGRCGGSFFGADHH